MNYEQIQKAYWDGYNEQINRNTGDPFSPIGSSLANAAGLKAVARKQALLDAQIAWDVAASQFQKGHVESAFGANLVREKIKSERENNAEPE